MTLKNTLTHPYNNNDSSEFGALSVDELALSNYLGAVPKHIAVIMDGNGRWAKQRGMRRIRGHYAGAQAVRRIVEACRYIGVEVLTLYAFSEQNWSRPIDEVSGLMTLFDFYIKRERKRLHQHGVCVQVIGDRHKLSAKLQRSIADIEAHTFENNHLLLQIAVSYGGREEIVHAARALAHAVANGDLSPDDVTAKVFESHLYTAGVPDPDLIIRTSGELRISNFLLWQMAYSEIHVTETLWPDFDEHHLVQAFEAYSARERRFGKTGAQIRHEPTP